MAVTISVELTFATASEARRERVQVPLGATVAEALAASDLAAVEAAAVAIHGEVVAPTRVLREGERIDLLRPLPKDPMTIRRQRATATRKVDAR